MRLKFFLPDYLWNITFDGLWLILHEDDAAYVFDMESCSEKSIEINGLLYQITTDASNTTK